MLSARRLAFALLVVAGAQAILACGGDEIARTRVYWASVAVTTISIPFALLSIALLAGLLLNWLGNWRSKDSDAVFGVLIAGIAMFRQLPIDPVRMQLARYRVRVPTRAADS